ncbi:hypothetical protein XA68_17689 [Ophiocordyceps unilateralis]|uniref:methionyl-tRNA formyltransferase n=1 Tax=Ophiocordyceps unilateralis TaxID=268505 RepID=A0A2A9P466_OPHUN|nr:hypothetical protein XA68_17689 [Ophiocordyceps unilateralis]
MREMEPSTPRFLQTRAAGGQFQSTPRFGAASQREQPVVDEPDSEPLEPSVESSAEDAQHEPSLFSTDDRQTKRRRITISPDGPSSPLAGHNLGTYDATSSHESDDSREEVEVEPRATQNQPVFHSAPRFKPTEAVAVRHAPAHQGYLPGGLAAGLQERLSEARVRAGSGVEVVLTVEQVRPGRVMQLVQGKRVDGADSSGKWILAGVKAEEVVVGCIIKVREPTWEVKVEGEVWTVVTPNDSRQRHARHLYRTATNDATAMMLRPLVRRALRNRPCHSRRFESTAHEHQSRASDPLRILFCGSDSFGCESLRALHGEHARDERFVEALDVMVLPPKRVGRGMKQIREVPCKALAEELRLPVHQRATFTKWEVPSGTNLIVVVSFGLFVPPRILHSTKYGGVNVHPSFLPDLRGPAPIHHALLRGDRHIGVSLQTLDDKCFDHGTILAQTPSPGLAVPSGASIQEVTALAATAGAQMLVQGLRDGLHVPPHRDAGWKAVELADRPLTHAPKVSKADSQVDWARWTTAEDFTRCLRVFASVWTRAADGQGQFRRLILQDVMAVEDEPVGVEGSICFEHDDADTTRLERTVRLDEASGACSLRVSEGVWVRLMRVKVEGKDWQDAATALGSFLSGGVQERKVC